MTVFVNNLYHYDLSLISEAGKNFVVLIARLGMIDHIVKKVEVPILEMELKVVSCATHYTFVLCNRRQGISLDTRYLSSETSGGFTGVYWGLFAMANKKTSFLWADFDWFRYKCIN